MTETSDNPPPGPLTACPKCGCREMFLRKNFPQKLGLGLVIGAALAFLVLAANRATFHLGVGVLLAVTLLDAALYFVVRKVTVCYRCRAEFRDVPLNPEHTGYELAVGEKYRER